MKGIFTEKWCPDKRELNLIKNDLRKNHFDKKCGYYSQLLVRGVGFKIWVNGPYLNIDVGLTHYVSLYIPSTISVVSKKIKLVLFSKNKQNLFNFIYVLKNIKLPDSYKGKGIRFFDENIHLKIGKIKS